VHKRNTSEEQERETGPCTALLPQCPQGTSYDKRRKWLTWALGGH